MGCGGKKWDNSTNFQPNLTHHSNSIASFLFLGTIGPIIVNIISDPLQLYAGGIYDDEEACAGNFPNHAVVTIGYGTESGSDYWLLKNSWGTSWGESGYFRLHRNYSVCAILLDASYPVV